VTRIKKISRNKVPALAAAAAIKSVMQPKKKLTIKLTMKLTMKLTKNLILIKI
jgi:hypothetical protein